MVSRNGTEDYVVLRGPSKIDPNIYKAATFLVLGIAAIALVVIQLCRKRLLRHYAMCRVCIKDRPSTVENEAKKVSVQSTCCASSNRSQTSRKGPISDEKEGNTDKEANQPMLTVVAAPMEDNRVKQPTEISEERDPEKIEVITEQLIEDSCTSCVSTASGPEKQFSPFQDVWLRVTEHSSNDLAALEDADQENSLQRRRRSAVCLSMPCGQSLPDTCKTPTNLSPEEVRKRTYIDMDANIASKYQNETALPQLQVNGESCDGDVSCTIMSRADDKNEDIADEGQLQCIVRYDEKQSVLIVRSVYVITTIDPGVPGLLVEVTLLPMKKEAVKSKVYLSAQREIDLAIKETFHLQCSKEDVEKNSLFIAVKPMFSSFVLFAETELKDLSLLHDKEVMLGGNLKSLSDT